MSEKAQGQGQDPHHHGRLDGQGSLQGDPLRQDAGHSAEQSVGKSGTEQEDGHTCQQGYIFAPQYRARDDLIGPGLQHTDLGDDKGGQDDQDPVPPGDAALHIQHEVRDPQLLHGKGHIKTQGLL